MRRAALRLLRSRAINLRRGLLAAALALCTTAGAFAATPEPHPSAAAVSKVPARIDVTKVQPKALLPKHAEHAEYVVEINKLGQVAKIRSAKGSDSPTFNAQTFGNAQQAFIRTPDGHVILGSYKLTYDYDPKTERVKRDVSLVSQGGVDPNAKGAALILVDKAAKQAAKQSGGHAIAPAVAPSVDPRNLPDLPSIGEPTPLPTSH